MTLLSFQELLQSHQDKGNFLSFYTEGHKEFEIDFRNFHHLTLCLAQELYDQYQVREGQRIALVVGNSVETYLSYAAVLYLGAVIVPLNPQDTIEYLQNISTHAEVSLTLTSEEFMSIGENLLGAVGIVRREELRFDSYVKIPALNKDPFLTPASLFYTSGTTGSPKGVLLSWGNLLTNLEGTQKVTHFTSASVLMSCLPLFHVNAFNFAFLLPIYLGCHVVYQSPFFQLGFWRVARRENVEAISLVPTVLRVLTQDKRQIDTGSVRFVISAASPLDRDLFKAFTEKYKIRITQAYGLSETVNFSLFTPPDLDDETYEQVTLGEETPSAGTPVWGNEVSLVDEAGTPITVPGKTGELLIHGKNVFAGYFNNPAATKAAFDQELFRTGDLGYYREFQGRKFFFLQGRSKEIIKRNGEIIYLAEVDGVLRKHGLIEACAVGFKNDFTGEEVGLYVSQAELPQAAAALEKTKASLGFARSPKVIVSGEQFPQTSVGKIKRKSLEPLFAEYAQTNFKNS